VHVLGLVGRAQQFSALRSGAKRAKKGSGGLFVVTGPAGIGKTRLGDRRSAAVLALGADPLDAAREGRDEAAAREPLADHLARRAGARRGTRASLISAEARFALSDAIVAFLRESAKRSPLALLLDDLHAADVPPLELLHFIARGLR
jgi:predicted ATPase